MKFKTITCLAIWAINYDQKYVIVPRLRQAILTQPFKHYVTHYNTNQGFRDSKHKAFENIVGQGENTRNLFNFYTLENEVEESLHWAS